MKKELTYTLIFTFTLLTLTSCEKDETTIIAGVNSLIATQAEAPGINCTSGGLKISYGIDANKNNILDTIEIEHSDYVCNGTSEPVQLDNLTRIPLGSPDAVGCEINWVLTPHDSWMLHDFDKTDYYNVSEILFVPSIVNYYEGNKVTVELFNVTDNVSIANSELVHDNGDFVVRYSGDIYDNLPAYPITLSIRIKNSMSGACGGLGTFSYLYVIRE